VKYVAPSLATVNVVVVAATVSADPVQRRMPSGDELRLSVSEVFSHLITSAFPLARDLRFCR
jgi:hypothetical protein